MRNQPSHADCIEQWLSVLGADGIGPTLFRRLLDYVGSPAEILKASEITLTAVEGIGPAKARKIKASLGRFDTTAELSLADRLGVHLIHLNDPRYPSSLKSIYDPPPVLYIKGRLQSEHALAVAIVGARRASIYGQEQASRLAYQLASSGFTVISGMARGIDTAAHQGALAAGGQTLAIQGCGLARIFPPENQTLFTKIADAGACISEFPLTYEPLPQNFPARNRIIAGLSLGTIVVEATPRSGALITARCALDQNREVMAVPGRIDSPLSRGPHRLLRDGATIVTSVQDVVEALGVVGRQLKDHVKQAIQKNRPDLNASPRPALDPTEQRIYEQLAHAPQHTDHIVANTQLPAGTVTATLVGLQLKGMVRCLPGNLFAARR
ncbi:DNA-processing protein DprA [Planctomycetota bacterium]